MAIFKLLDTAPFVRSYKVLDFKAWSTGRYIKIEIALHNGTFLHVREYNDEKERNYSFHWQDEKGKLIVRWDNSPHHGHLSTFPHHRHTGERVEESADVSLEDVLKYLDRRL